MKNTIYFICIALILSACEGFLFEEEPVNDPIGNFESLWQTFNAKYAVFEQRGVDWESLYSEYRPQVTSSTTDEQLFTVVTNLLSHLDDGHVSLMAAGRPFWSGNREFRERTKFNLFDFELVRNEYISGSLQIENNQYAYGKIGNDIGYLFIAKLSGDSPQFIDDFIQMNQSSKGIIIDLRHNDGGDFTNAKVIASRFTSQKVLAFSTTPKNGPEKNDFGDTFDYYLEPNGSQLFTKSVVVITNSYTISAGENLVLYLRELPHVTVIGENTSGAMGERIEKEMPNGWIYSISGQIVTAADGNCYEGPGIPPEVHVLNIEEELAKNTDTMLETALEMLD